MTIRVKLKTSKTAGAAPLPADLIEGEIALNINPASVAAYTKDSAGTVVKLTGTNDAGGSISPTPADVTASSPFSGGTGTQADPFVLFPSIVPHAGGVALSNPTVTIKGKVGGVVAVVDTNAAANGARFDQAAGFVGVAGSWSGRFSYLDTPKSTAVTTFTGLLKVGTVYFRWVVTQELAPPPPPLTAVTIPTVSGATEPGSVLTAVPGTATGGAAPISYVTRWQASPDGTSTWVDIAGATGNTYTLHNTDVGRYMRAVTKATDTTFPNEQILELPSLATAKVAMPTAAQFSWSANTDIYSREAVASRNIDVHSRVRRCLVADAGGVTYLDADDSTKLAGDWLRLCETTQLDAEYTGTHGAEVANTALRDGLPSWTAGTYTKGKRVIYGGQVWECLAATTSAIPLAGASAADLTGGAGQVMVEVPCFSVWHDTTPDGTFLQHSFHVTLGVKGGVYSVHPAFVKPDGSYRDYFYIGAYQATEANGDCSTSGQSNTVNKTRAEFRTAFGARGTGWRQLGYWDYSALQWLLITEYQDMNSQRVLGNGASESSSYSTTLHSIATSGLSDVRGNRSGQLHSPAGGVNDYVSYRGIENIYGRASQWVDGFNLDRYNVYLCADPSKWDDDTSTDYTPMGTVPVLSGSTGVYLRDIAKGAGLLPSVITGASATTYVGDASTAGSGVGGVNPSTGVWELRTPPGWRVACVGGNTHRISGGTQSGVFCGYFDYSAADRIESVSSRLCYAA